MSPSEARRHALVAFGGAEQLKEAHRDARGTRWLEDVTADLRFAARSLRRNAGLTVTAVATLALVIGANTAIFSTVDAVLLRPLPFADPDRLVMVGENNREFLWHMADAAPANFLDWRARVPAFRDAMAYADFPGSVTLMVDGVPQLAATAVVVTDTLPASLLFQSITTSIVAIAAIFGPLLVSDPLHTELLNRLRPPGTSGHLLGTDQLGRGHH